ncbi:MAG: LysM peptidoglycan-binding domain-containing protein [Planctomycetota bacterium]|nr:LysM peptidoglycan-binding domain-containing protein [Planctomycetota bacterium]
MTRETKIGLLVGLAFIIVIGILLSDHLTSTTEPPQARLTQAGSNVRQGVSVPGGATANPPITSVEAPAPVTPQQQIPTKEDLKPKPQPVQIVQIGPSGQQPPVSVGAAQPFVQAPAPLIAQPPTQPQEPQRVPLENPIVPQQPQIVESTPVTADPALTKIATQIGEEIVELTGQQQPTPPAQPNGATGATTLAGGKAYKAQEGDTLSKLAGRFMGGNTKTNRDAIVKANPSLTKNPDIVVVGRTYIIPTNGAVATNNPQPAQPVQTPTATPEYFYTVKDNDTLRKIATNQMGDEDAWAAIQDLNKTTLKGEDKTVVVPGMKLRLPAKPLASAN